MLNLVLFGPPGAGKGTQSERLVKKYQLVHLSTGDIFRANISAKTELGQLAKNYMDKGQLVPDELTIKMLDAEVEKNPGASGFIFDGFPRTTAQAEALDKLLAKKDTAISAMLSLEVSEPELRQRLKKRAETSGRSDDADPKVIQKRIDVYQKQTAPLKDYYHERNKLVKIEGEGSIDAITQRLFQAIDSVCL